MKVLMVVADLPPRFSGIGDYATHLMRAMARRGVCVTAVTTVEPSAPSEEQCNGVQVKRVIRRWTFAESRTILQLLDRMGEGTVVNIQYAGPGYGRRIMINLLPALLGVVRPQICVVTTLHEFGVQSVRWRLRSWPFLAASRGVIYPNRRERDVLRRWSCFRKLPLCYIPVASSIPRVPCTPEDRVKWRRRLGFAGPVGEPIAVFFGGISAQKGFAELLDAVEAVRRDGINLRLLIVGGFQRWVAASLPYQRCMEERIQLGLRQGWIVRRDRVPKEVVSQCLHAADVALFPFARGVRENRTSVLAALDHGCPTLTTQGVETPPDFAETFGARCVPAGSPRAFRRELARLLRSPEELAALREKAQRASGYCTWDSVAEKTIVFFQSLTR